MSVFESIFETLKIVDDFYWSNIGFLLVVISGVYFTFKSRFFQFRQIGRLGHTIRELKDTAHHGSKGTNPLRLYFASVGGMVGLGNIVGVITALIIGGPGALFWLWIAAFCGMLIKYAEIYLGILHRVPNQQGSYDGGPMYYLQQAFKSRFIPIVVSVLLCIYGVEIFQFLIITDTLCTTFSLNRFLVITALIVGTLYTGLGGVKRLANVCTVLMPAFMIIYVLMCLWVIGQHLAELPSVLQSVFNAAFTGHAPLGGFAGSTFVLAAQHGIARAVYSGDIGVGYDSAIQSETQTAHPERQARLAVFSLATDTLVCTMSMLVVLITGVWHTVDPIQASQFVATALGRHFPYIEVFMAIFFFLAGFTTILAFFTVGMKSARFISPRFGAGIYLLYAITAFLFFSFFDQSKVILIMSLSGGLLMLFNLWGIMRLREQIKFH